jgi:hypothetical protein
MTMFENMYTKQKALGIIFIALCPLIFSILPRDPHTSGGLIVIRGLASAATSAFGILILRHEIVYVIVRMILRRNEEGETRRALAGKG